MENLYLLNIILFLLHTEGIRIKRSTLIKVLLSCPSYPSLASVSQTLSYFGLKNNAFLTDLEHLENLRNVIVHTREDNGHFYILKEYYANSVSLYDGADIKLCVSEFLAIWDGIIIMPEGNSKVYHQIKHNNKITFLVFLLLGFMVISGCLLFKNNLSTIDFLLDFAGIFLTYRLLRSYLYDYQVDSFCKMNVRIDCKYVSHLNPIKRWVPIDLPVLGFFFFLFDIFFILLCGCDDFLKVSINLVAGIVMLILVCYQIIKIRKYCIYCLTIALLIFIKIYFFLQSLVDIIFLITLPKFIFIITLSIVLSLVIYNEISFKNNLEKRSISLLKLKRTPKIIKDKFSEKHPNYPTEGMMEFGNKNANIIITTFISLQCRHCEDVVKDILNLLKTFPQNFLWRVMVEGINHSTMSNEMFVKLNSRQLNLIRNYKINKEICLSEFHRWDFKPIMINEDETIENYKSQLVNMQKMKITHYPIIWINDRILPHEYSIDDIQYIQDEIIQLE